MELTKAQAEKFKKLGINSIAELALCIPNAYEDYRLHETLIPHTPQLIDATVENLNRTPNSLQITFFAHNLGYRVYGVMFHVKPYMLHQFSVGERNYYYGVLDCKQGRCSMSMPKKVSLVGAVTPKYKTALRSDVMFRLTRELLSKEALMQEGIGQDIADTLLALHFPSQTQMPNLEKELSREALYALKYTELFVYMKALSSKRKYFPSLLRIDAAYTRFIQQLPFTLTQEQLSAIEEIKKDFSKEYAARRMIVGDVGSGKTMVILATAAMMHKHTRAILMAPTTILANQLFEEAQKYLPWINIVLVTNKSKKVPLEEYDFVIGTHALLYRELPEAGVVMVDEQHRFGTQQRKLLEQLVSKQTKKPHYLQFSATPIPRTQAMIDAAHIDVSLITTTPFKKDIESHVIHKENFKELLSHIQNEIKQKRQVLLVYPLVNESEMMAYQSINEARSYWEKNFEGVYVTHGKDKDKEEVLLEFREKGSILIATTVVEVGISLPRLSTVVIVGAERLGLSTLHQLRGRVSRTGLKGYCFLYTNQQKSQRLEEFCKTESGFAIANLDLKYRKSGDLLQGKQQSGKSFRWFDFAEDEDVVQRVREDLKQIKSS
jgi:ATP-dependent DNA helicase RecG